MFIARGHLFKTICLRAPSRRQVPAKVLMRLRSLNRKRPRHWYLLDPLFVVEWDVDKPEPQNYCLSVRSLDGASTVQDYMELTSGLRRRGVCGIYREDRCTLDELTPSFLQELRQLCVEAALSNNVPSIHN
jgi:hypothetical protein